MNDAEKHQLKIRIDHILFNRESKTDWKASGLHIQALLKRIRLDKLLPTLNAKGQPWKRRGEQGEWKIYNTYLNYLVEESLKYPIDIYIPYIGKLCISEIDGTGLKSKWMENGEWKYRMDTVFDRGVKVKYWMHLFIFGMEAADYSTKFIARTRYIKPILRKIYLTHPDGGFYTTRL